MSVKTTVSQMIKLFEHLQRQIFYITLFAVAFVIIGASAPPIYYRYLDQTQYLTIKMPIGTDAQEYKTCGKIIFVSKYTAANDIYGVAHTQWIKINEDGTTTIVEETQRQIVFPKAEDKVFSILSQIPCDLDPGKYVISGIGQYSYQHVDKSITFVSVPFDVSASPSATIKKK